MIGRCVETKNAMKEDMLSVAVEMVKYMFYYVNDEGELCLRVNEDHTYDDGSSSSGETVY